MFTKYLPTLALSTIIATSALSAAPLRSTRGLPPEGQIIAHIDADAFRASKIGKGLTELSKAPSEKNKNQKNAELEKIAIEFIDTLSDATFGAQDSESDLVAVIRGTFTKKQVEEFFKAVSVDYKVEKIGESECYVVTVSSPDAALQFPQMEGAAMPGKNQTCIFTFINGSKKNFILLATSEKNSARKTFAQALNNYKEKKSMPIPPALKKATGTPILQAATFGSALKDETFSEFSDANFFLMESAGTVSITATGTCKSADAATKKVGEGQQMLGLFSMILAMNPGEAESAETSAAEKLSRDFIIKILTSTKISGSGNNVNIATQLPADAIIDFVKGSIDTSQK